MTITLEVCGANRDGVAVCGDGQLVARVEDLAARRLDFCCPVSCADAVAIANAVAAYTPPVLDAP